MSVVLRLVTNQSHDGTVSTGSYTNRSLRRCRVIFIECLFALTLASRRPGFDLCVEYRFVTTHLLNTSNFISLLISILCKLWWHFYSVVIHTRLG